VSRRWVATAVFTIVGLQAFAALAADFNIPPTPDHFVTDNAAALSPTTRGELENELQRYERSTGHQVIVWIGETTGDVPLETFTGESADRWKVGRRGHDDGAVLFLFMQDRRVRIEVGYGLESSLTDADSYRIIQDVILPRMRSRDVDGAVSSGVAAMLTTITPSYAAVTPPPAPYGSHLSIGTNAGIFIVVALGLALIYALFFIIIEVVATLRFGYLVLREGTVRAKRDMRRGWTWNTGAFIGGGLGGAVGGFGGGGFSAGGGGFGGGGASGGW
jgi:uncharacterized protein